MGVNMRRFFVAMQNGGHKIICTESFFEPFQIVVAPVRQFAVAFELFHILVRTGQHHANCPNLIFTNLACNTCRFNAMLNCIRAIGNSVGKWQKFAVEMAAGFVRILRLYRPLDMSRHCRIVARCLC